MNVDGEKNKIEKQMDDFQKTLKSLEDVQKQMVDKYQMKEGDYKIIIKILEASELVPKPAKYTLLEMQKSACDAFVEITIRDQVKTTPVRYGTNNPIFQQQYNFEFTGMSVHDLNHSKIVFKVLDKNYGFSFFNSGIGLFELDWTNVYFRRFHEIYRAWLTLSDPQEIVEGPVGYLLVDIAVLGPQDKIQVHDSAYIKNPLTTVEDTITNTKVALINFSLTIDIYRAEHLIPLDLSKRSVDAFVVAKFSGNKVRTKELSSLNPQWNESLKIGTGVPNKTKYLILEVWNHNYIGYNDLIGTIQIPFIDICEDKFTNVQWGHLYGPPMCAKDEQPHNYASKMQIYGQNIGSHYRGRILFKVTGKKYVYTKTASTDIQFKFPFKPTPVVPLKTYTLSVELFEGFQLPQRKVHYIHIGIGQYLIKAELKKVQKRVGDFYFILDDKKVQFPEDRNQIPDIIIYFCDGLQESNRMSFFRIKAKDAVTVERRKHPVIYQMIGDKSLNMLQQNEIGGCLTLNINLYEDAVPRKKIELQYKQEIPHTIVFYLYKGQGFPPANEQGDCDPFIRFTCKDKYMDSNVEAKSLNPFWQQTLKINSVSIQDIINHNITKGIICEAYDHQQGGNNQFIGSFLIEANNAAPKLRRLQKKDQQNKFNPLDTVSFIYEEPKWYYLINPHIELGNNMFGKILLSYAIFKDQDILKNKVIAEYAAISQPRDPIPRLLQNATRSVQNPNSLRSKFDLIPKEQKLIQIYLIGVRNIRDKKKNIIMSGKIDIHITISGGAQFKFLGGNLQKSGSQINKLIEHKVNIPKNKRLLPFVDFKVEYDGQFYGFNSTDLYKLLPKLAEKEDKKKIKEQESEETMFDAEDFQYQIQMIRQKRRQDKQSLNKDEGKKDLDGIPCPIELGNVDKGRHVESNQKELDDRYNHEIDRLKEPQYQYIKTLAQRHVQLKGDKPQQKAKEIIANRETFKSFQTQSKMYSKNEIETLQIISGKKESVFDRLRSEKGKNTSMNVSALNISKNSIRQEQEQEQNVLLQASNEGTSQYIKGEDNEPSEKEIKVASKKKELQQLNDNQENLLKVKEEMNSRYKTAKRSSVMKTTKLKEKKGQVDIDDINVQIQTDQNFENNPFDERVINYKDVQRVMVQEQKDEKEAIEIDKEYKFANAVKLSIFGWNRKKKRTDVETYDDYDTDPAEQLDITPEWYKGRHIHSTDFEDLHFKRASKIHSIQLYGGQKLQNSNLQVKQKRPAGQIKMIIMSQNSENSKKKEETYTKLLKPKEYYCRIYILKGKSLISGYDSKPSTYLRFTYSDKVVSYKEKTYVQKETNPEYYTFYEVPMTLPGPCLVKIEVIQTYNMAFLDKIIERVLGYTEIDLQQRYFMKTWYLYEKKPIELRNLYSQYGMGSQGRLQTFIQLIEKKRWISTPPYKIQAPPFIPFELRVIAWKTDDCVYKNVEMESNDIYVRANVGVHDPQQTDTHWACRAVGNFNYRMKFKVNYPPKPEDMYSDVFNVQIWDRDLVGYNNLIGETRINMNQMHRIIEKAVKRNKSVQAKKKIKEKGFIITDRFWFDVFNNREKNEFGIPQSQGRVQLSFELVPYEESQKQKQNGYGRNTPNNYPPLQEPEGRLSFDFFSPLSFIKQIVGPKLYAKWCCKLICCLLIVLLGIFGYIFLPTLIATSITK